MPQDWGDIHFFVQVVFFFYQKFAIYFVFLKGGMRGDPFELKKNGLYIQIHQVRTWGDIHFLVQDDFLFKKNLLHRILLKSPDFS